MKRVAVTMLILLVVGCLGIAWAADLVRFPAIGYSFSALTSTTPSDAKNLMGVFFSHSCQLTNLGSADKTIWMQGGFGGSSFANIGTSVTVTAADSDTWWISRTGEAAEYIRLYCPSGCDVWGNSVACDSGNSGGGGQ